MKTTKVWGVTAVMAMALGAAAQTPAPAPEPEPFVYVKEFKLDKELAKIDKLDLKLDSKIDVKIDKEQIKESVKAAAKAMADVNVQVAIEDAMFYARQAGAGDAVGWGVNDGIGQGVGQGVSWGVGQGVGGTMTAGMGQGLSPERQQEISARAAERAQEAVERARERQDRMREDVSRDDENYRRGTELLDSGKYDKAAESFDIVAKHNGPRADGALYWKAWALYKQGAKDQSVASLKALTDGYPTSRWKNDAKALEVEVKQSTGTPMSPGDLSDEEMKLIAITALLRNDPEKAIPYLDKMLKGSASPRLKDRALFVLANNGTNTQARDMVVQIAKGGSNPDLQLKAITYLGRFGSTSRQTLGEIYASTPDVTVKRRILQAYFESGDKDHLLSVAKTEPAADLRMDAVRGLANMNARDEVWQLYGAETSSEVKMRIISSLYSDGFSDKVAQIARTEKDAQLRRAAVRTLANFRGHSDLLVGLYAPEQDDQIKKEILRSLRNKDDAKALVDIARAEKNPELKREAVSILSTMKAKEATDYMMELLK